MEASAACVTRTSRPSTAPPAISASTSNRLAMRCGSSRKLRSVTASFVRRSRSPSVSSIATPARGRSSSQRRKSARATRSVVVGSVAMADADLGCPSSSASSPSESPRASVASVASRPVDETTTMRTLPCTIV